MGEWKVAHQRHIDLCIELLGFDRAADRILRIAERIPRDQQGIWLKPALVFTILEPRSETHRSGRQVKQRARDIAGEADLLIPASVALIDQDIISHF